MEDEREPRRPRQFGVQLDPEDYEALVRVVKHRRSTIAQVVREFIVSGIEQDRRISSLIEREPVEAVG